jgi:hypothetical protein
VLPFSRTARSHPTTEVLALYSRGDLPAFPRLRLKAHLLECVKCEHQVELFAASLSELKREAASETLTAFEAIADWKVLEREMIGNIVVGVAAARCIDNVGRKRAWLSRLAFGAGLIILFVAGWITHIPSEQTRHLTASLSRIVGLQPPGSASINMVQATPNAIAVRSQGVTLSILHPPTAVVSLSGNSSMEARYVDEESGQLTIASVYGQ